MARKNDTPKNIPVKLSLLSKEDKELLEKEARASVLAEMQQDARDEYFKQAITKIRRDHIPSEQIVHVSMDLAPFLPHVMIDGVMYFHGYSYDVPRSQAIVLYEQMQRSWMHQDEIEGRSRFNAYRRPQNIQLGPRHMGQATIGANGPVSIDSRGPVIFPENAEI